MRRLSWKIALSTALLVIAVILLFSVPLYWHTRQVLENQLADNMTSNARLLESQFDLSLIEFLNNFPESTIIKDSLEFQLNQLLTVLSANALYLINSQGIILVTAGNRAIALQSSILNRREILSAINGEITPSPLFSDESDRFFKSLFYPVSLSDNQRVVFGIDADVHFLAETVRLRNTILSIASIITLVSIIIGLLFSQAITQPLYQLTRFASDIGKGRSSQLDFSKRHDEIGFLGQTMRKMQSEIEQREKENKQLIASVAHEIRNPLGGMKVNVDLLLEESQQYPELLPYAQAITREINHLSEIIETFLAYARPMEKNISPHDVRDMLDKVLEDIKRNFAVQNITITGNGRVDIHSGKIQHAFYNLIKNGIEASGKYPDIQVDISTTGNQIKISFRNRGRPIPMEIQPQIFDPFFTTKESGVGLGLSITKSIVEQHGGKIYLLSSNEFGTEFVVELPGSRHG
jgi:signal transduction histidine kinase